MKTISKVISLFLSLILCALILPAGVFADDPVQNRRVESDGFVFSIQNNEASFVSYMGKETEIVIPESVEGCPVTHIGYGVFQSKSKAITSVVIPDTVTSIHEGAFSGCVKMTSVVLSKNLTEITAGSFSSCSALKSVTIPKNVKKIGINAFASCLQLETVVMEDGLTLIDEDAFTDCAKLKNLVVPGTVKTIGSGAFSGCSSLESVTLCEGVETLGSNAFRGCGLRSLFLPKSIKNIAFYAVAECPDLKKINYAGLRSDWDKIAVDYDYEDLLSMEVEFKDGTSQQVRDLYTSFRGIKDTFSYLAEDGKVTIEKFIPDKFDRDKQYDLTIPTEINGMPVTRISEKAFYNNSSIVSVTINGGNGLVIGSKAFSECSNLKKLVITGNVDISEQNIFLGCGSLEELSIGKGVRTIGRAAFWRCNSLEKLVLPEGVETIDEQAFSECVRLSSVSIPKSAVNIHKKAFWNDPALAHFTVASGNPVFHSSGDCLIETASKTLVHGSLSSVIPADGSVTRIGEGAFFPLFITSVAIPDCIEYIDADAFTMCAKLTSVVIPGSVKSVGRTAFAGCETLKTLVINEGVKELGDGAFRNCALTSVRLPKSLTKIGNGIFENCVDLKKIHYAGTKADWGRITIDPIDRELFAAEIVFEGDIPVTQPVSSARASTAKKTSAPASTAKKTEAPVSTKAQESAVPATASVTNAPETSGNTAQIVVSVPEAGLIAAPSQTPAVTSTDTVPASSVDPATPSASATAPQSSGQNGQNNDPTVWIVVGVVAVAAAAAGTIVFIKKKQGR